MWLSSITGQSGHINQSTSIFLPKKLCHSLSGLRSRQSRTVVSGYSVLACKQEYFPLHPSQVPCTCPLLTLSSLSIAPYFTLECLTMSRLIWLVTSPHPCDVIGQWPPPAPAWSSWLTTDVPVCGVWPCVSCVRVLSGVPCTSHPDPVITGGGDKICRASCNMSPANQGPEPGASDQSETSTASHIAWEAAVITINNNVLIRDPATRRLNNSSDLATASQSPQTLWPHCDCLDKMWRKVQSPGAGPAYLCVCPPSSSLSRYLCDDETLSQHGVTRWQSVWPHTWPRVMVIIIITITRYWSGARQVRHGVGE